MTVQECRAKLKQCFVDSLYLEGIAPEDIADDAPLFSADDADGADGKDGLGLDSLDAVEIVVLLEKEFGVEIKDAEEARKIFTSVAALADYILAHQSK